MPHLTWLAAAGLALASAAGPIAAQAPATRGAAAPGAIVQRGPARFTILTPGLIRMEWAADERFVDQPSQVFVDRQQPVPAYTVKTRGDRLVIETASLRLSYRLGSGRFTAANLEVRSKRLAPAFTWHPGDPEPGNLGGTARTLDRFSGDKEIGTGKPIDLGQGLLSRDGWHVVDDSNSFLFDNSDWPWAARRSCADCQDLYFFGYGHDYTRALGDYARVAGREPMPPRFAFGYWWSRYWNYSDDEMRALVGDFERFRIPVDVMVVDMDWHRTDGLSADERFLKRDVFGETVGWTGYTWNRSLYPDPTSFLGWLHQKGLKTTLNLHPAAGIPENEESYPEVAKATGVAKGNPVPFEAADRRFVDSWFRYTLDPLRKKGVDFWWLDWQQFPESKLVPGLSNTWWLNYMFYSHMQRNTSQRALIYHRWGGMGNHRYQIGFSGDSIISWPSLAFQPHFTSTASNVLYGYWSHDIGGHFYGDDTPEADRSIDPELYVRWMQFGTFSPILRTHSSKEPGLRKEPWRFSPEVFAALKQSIELRYALAPYIYTAARQAYDTGVSIVRPLYYGWPDSAEAYKARSEYMFGDDMLVAPVTAPAKDGIASVSIWLPPGRWFDANRGALIDGGRTVTRDYTLDEIPLFLRAGAVIPLNPSSVTKLQAADDGRIVLRLVPGGTSRTRLYSDAGDSEGYRNGECAWTPVEGRRDAREATLTVGAREGTWSGMPATRQVTVELPAATIPERVTVNGTSYERADADREGSWSYDATTLTARVTVPAQAASAPLEVRVAFAAGAPDVDGLAYRMKRVAAAVTYLKENWEPRAPLPDDVSIAGQLGRVIHYEPQRMAALVGDYDARLSRSIAAVNASQAKPEVKARFAAMIAAARQ